MDFGTILFTVVGGIILILALVNGTIFYLISKQQKEKDQREGKSSVHPGPGFKAITNKYETIAEVQTALRKAGLERSDLILGIDYTASNVYTGRNTFGGRSLHDLSQGSSVLNPYQEVIQILGKTLEPFDADRFIPTYGFGDESTTDRSVLPFFTKEEEELIKKSVLNSTNNNSKTNEPNNNLLEGWDQESTKILQGGGFQAVLVKYGKITPNIRMKGPTNFGPIIREAIRIVKERNSYHILVIIADGQVDVERDTKSAIVEASQYPLSILVVGVGDGPWHMMKKFDNELPKRRFDNFQFVNFHEVKSKALSSFFEAAFALESLMEIPKQYTLIRKFKIGESD